MICRNHIDVAEGVRRCVRCGDAFCASCLVAIQDRSYCAPCKTEQLLDVRSGVDRSRPRYGGFWARFGAFVIDALIVGVPAYLIFFGVMMSVALHIQKNPGAGPPAFLLAAYVPLVTFPMIYEGLMLWLKNGQTVGKTALRLRVVRSDGSRITAAQAWARAVMRVLLGCVAIVDYVPYFFTEEKTTLHDMVAGTRVVVSE